MVLLQKREVTQKNVKLQATHSPLWFSLPDAYLISFLIPRAVEDIENKGHLAEPYDDPEPRTAVNPHISRGL